jgi:hypothetical protein
MWPTPQCEDHGDVPIEFTGISIPWFGIQWQKKRGDKDVARRVLAFLEDRRVLFPYSERNPEEALHCLHSAIEIRRYLTNELHNAKPGGGLADVLRGMRAAARRFVEAGGPDGQNWRPGRRRGAGADAFSVALGEFRSTMGVQIAAVAVTFGLPVEPPLADVLPPRPAEDD